MSQAVYLIFFLVTLLAVISTPANASPLEKKWDKECCRVAKCVFEKDKKPTIKPPVTNLNYYGNTFDGFLVFTETPKTKLQINGFIDIRGVTSKVGGPKLPFPNTPLGSVEGFYDIHVEDCATANTAKPGDPPAGTAIIDLDDQFFGAPIITTVPNPLNTAATYTVDKIRNKCCFVVEEYASEASHFGGVDASPRNERILGIAPIEIVEDCGDKPAPPP